MTELSRPSPALPPSETSSDHRDGGPPALLVVTVGPFIAFQLASHALGLGETSALLVATAVPAAATAGQLVRRRKPDAVALVVLTLFATRLVIAAAGAGPRLILSADAFAVGAVALLLCASVIARRPLAVPIVRRAAEAATAARPTPSPAWPALEAPVSRHRANVITLVWAAALAVSATAQLVLVFTLRASNVLVTGPIVHLCVGAAAGAWTMRYLKAPATAAVPAA